MNKKIIIVWIVNDMFTNNFITVYHECKKSDQFSMTVIAAPHFHWLKGEQIESVEVASFLRKSGIECIDSLNLETGKYFDISVLNPDYIFTTTPYDIYLPEVYKSNHLKSLAKLCHIEYGAIMIEWVNNYSDMAFNSYFTNASFIFTGFPGMCKYFSNAVCIGCLKLDEYLYYGREKRSSLWNEQAKMKVVWKPRWTVEQADSTFIKYIDSMYGFFQKHTQMDLVILIHPLLMSTLKVTEQYEVFAETLRKLKQLPNFHIEETSDFLDAVLSADVMIADHSSTVIEYSITGKPLIYTSSEIPLNDLGKSVTKYAYIARSFEDIVAILNNLFMGIDPEREMRENRKTESLYLPPEGMSVAQFLMKFLCDDYENVFESVKYYKKVARIQQQELYQKIAQVQTVEANSTYWQSVAEKALSRAEELESIIMIQQQELYQKIAQVQTVEANSTYWQSVAEDALELMEELKRGSTISQLQD
jgi:hypothetical protein